MSKLVAKLRPLRTKIDRLDREILKLISERADVVAQVGTVKRRLGLPIRIASRERKILRTLTDLNTGPLPSSSIAAIFHSLIEECRRFEASSCEIRDNSHFAQSQNQVKTVAVIGIGLMGGSLARALCKYAPEYRVIGFDPKLSRRATTEFKLTNTIQEALQADVVALAMPVSAILAFLRKEGAHLRPGTIVFDLGSTKKLIAETAKRTLPRGVCFVGGHPVAGKAVGGFANSEADLFQGRPFVLSVGSSPPERRAAREIERLILRIGGRPHRMNAADHDRMLALTSHLPQLLATALAATASRTLGRRLPIHGSAFFEMTRVAESDFVVWKDILETNKLYIANILVSYQNILQSFINYGDGRATQALFDEGCRFRKKLRLKKESSC